MAQSKVLSFSSIGNLLKRSAEREYIRVGLILFMLINSSVTFGQSNAAGIGGGGCAITPAAHICPNGTATYSAPTGTGYSWSISGSGTINGPANSKTVNVTAGANCNTTYKLTVTYTDASLVTTTCSQSIPIVDNTVPTIAGSPNKIVPNNTPNIIFDNPVIGDLCGTPSLVVISTTTSPQPDGSVNYTRTWKATDGCGNSSASISQTITVRGLIACTITGNNSICPGGTVSLCATAGATNYLWNTGATTQCITVSTAGTYSVTVTDNSGSSSCSKTITLTTPMSCAITGNSTICSGSSANICATAGATSYLWNNGSTSQCISPSTPGTYTVTIAESNGCTSSCAKEVTAGAPPVCSVSGAGSLCAGGTANICAPAGASSYLWSNGATTQCIDVSSAGNYTATITNANGCSSSCSKAIDINISANCLITGNPLICPGGTTQLCAPPGMIAYSWSTGATSQCITVNTIGNYAVTISGENGCTSSCSQTVSENVPPTCTISGSSTFCPGGSTNLCAPIGMSKYLWSTGATTQCISVNSAGTYSVTITNSSGCSNTCNTSVSASSPPTCSITGSETICPGGTTSLCAPAGMMAYSWSTGSTSQCASVNAAGTYTVTITNTDGCSSTCSKTVTITNPQSCLIGSTNTCGSANLCGPVGAVAYSWSTGATTQCIQVFSTGTYNLSVTDENGCISVCSKSATINSPHPCTITGNSTFCQGGSVSLCGPAAANAYLWSTGATTQCITLSNEGTYTLTVTDALGCNSFCSKVVTSTSTTPCTINGTSSFCQGSSSSLCAPAGASSYLWSNGATTQCTVVTTQGNYSVTTTDVNGCSITCNKNITVYTPQPCVITGNTSACAGGTVNLCAQAGGINYSWSTGATTQCVAVSSSGTYTAVITDENGCSNTCNKTVTINNPPTCEITGNTSFCSGGFTNLCAPAATAYSWSNGATSQCITVNSAGNYSVTITNQNGCTSTCNKTVTINNPPNCSITGNLLICTGGSSNLCATGNAASYSWNTGATTQCVTVTNSGNYAVTVTGANGCTTTCSQNIDFLPSPNCNITGTTTICSGTTTNLCSAQGAASYSWSNGATTRCTNVSAAGDYTVTATSVNGCTSTCTKTVVVNIPIECSITGNTSICSGGSTSLCAPEGGASYEWSSEATTNCITVNSSGTYSVIITDQNGCQSTCSKTVTLYQMPTCTITGNNEICQGNNTTFTASGGKSYIWNNGATTAAITISSPGQYSVNITNDNNCSSSCSRNLTVHNCGITLRKTPDICEFKDGVPTNVNFKYVIKNTGNYFSASGNLIDDNGTASNTADDINVCNWGPVAPGDSTSCSRAFTINTTHTNTAKASGTSGGLVVSASSTATVAGINCNCNLNYPDNSNLPRSAVIFNESEVLRASDPGTTTCGSTGSVIKLWYNDEHALLLGVRSVIVKSSNGITTTNYNITPTPATYGCFSNPLVGDTISTGDQSANDMASGGGRPLWPSIFITDLTVNGATSRVGDWQQGGKGIPPSRVCGTWKSATKTIDKTKYPPVVTITTDVDPAKNNWSLGSGSDTPPGGFASLKDEGYGAEVSWDVNSLGLLPGHTYRLVFMVHDGDQNKLGGDVGEACTTIHISDGNCAPGDTLPQPPTTTDKICYKGTSHSYVRASQEWTINTTTNQATIRTTFSKNFVDNTYGLSAIGWPNGHTFNQLVGSDNLQMALYDANNTKKMEFKLDYITSSNTVPSGYKCLGVTGGEGQMILGSASDVVSVMTSIDKNLNSYGYPLVTNSPATNSNYAPNASYPNWIFDVWYEVTIKLSAFGSAGFGKPMITSVHASPSKTGSNTELVVDTTCTQSFPRIAAPDSPTKINAIAYPNPFGDDITINFITPLDQDATIVITDVAGRIVESDRRPAGSFKMGSNLKAGIYFVRITQGDFYKIIKIIKSGGKE